MRAIARLILLLGLLSGLASGLVPGAGAQSLPRADTAARLPQAQAQLRQALADLEQARQAPFKERQRHTERVLQLLDELQRLAAQGAPPGTGAALPAPQPATPAAPAAPVLALPTPLPPPLTRPQSGGVDTSVGAGAVPVTQPAAPDPQAQDRACDAKFPGMRWFPAAHNGQGACFCTEGFWWSSSRQRCQSYQDFAQDYCDGQGQGLHPLWNAQPGGAYRCVCASGQSWSDDTRRCSSAQDYAQQWCASRYAGTTPLFKGGGAFDCQCPGGQWLNNRLSRCQSPQDFANDDCATRYPGTTPQWINRERFNCVANPAAAPPPPPAFDCEQAAWQIRAAARQGPAAASGLMVGAIGAGCDFSRLQQALSQGQADAAPPPTVAPPPVRQQPPPSLPVQPPPRQPPVGVAPIVVPPVPPSIPPPAPRCAWRGLGESLLGQSQTIDFVCFCGSEARRGDAALQACGPKPR